jgi:hypothetical protein
MQNNSTDDQLEEMSNTVFQLKRHNESLRHKAIEESREKIAITNENTRLKANLAKLDSEAKNFIKERNEHLEKLYDEMNKYKAELNELSRLKMLEIDEITSEFELKEFVLNQQLKETKEKLDRRFENSLN